MRIGIVMHVSRRMIFLLSMEPVNTHEHLAHVHGVYHGRSSPKLNFSRTAAKPP